MRQEKRANTDTSIPLGNAVAPILRAPTAGYQQLNPSIREGHVIVDWSGLYGGQIPRTTQGTTLASNRLIKKANGKPRS